MMTLNDMCIQDVGLIHLSVQILTTSEFGMALETGSFHFFLLFSPQGFSFSPLIFVDHPRITDFLGEFGKSKELLPNRVILIPLLPGL